MQSAQCPFCVNYQGNFKCRAFPEEIPPEFLTGERAHNKPEPGQVGRFVFKEGEPIFLKEKRR